MLEIKEKEKLNEIISDYKNINEEINDIENEIKNLQQREINLINRLDNLRKEEEYQMQSINTKYNKTFTINEIIQELND